MNESKRTPDPRQAELDSEWLDEVLRETFPASDPVPWRRRETPAKRSQDETPE